MKHSGYVRACETCSCFCGIFLLILFISYISNKFYVPLGSRGNDIYFTGLLIVLCSVITNTVTNL